MSRIWNREDLECGEFGMRGILKSRIDTSYDIEIDLQTSLVFKLSLFQQTF
jgi:hypothetical protein